jgi:hypothetical protein
MSTLLEFECQPPVGGYDVITIETPPTEGLPIRPGIRMLQARSDRTKQFNLFGGRPSSSPAFLELAQMPDTEDAIKDFADRYGPLFPTRVPMFLNRLVPDYQMVPHQVGRDGLRIDYWSKAIRQMHKTVKLWEMSRRNGDFSKLIRAARENREHFKLFLPRGVGAYFSLKEDPVSRSARLCLRLESLDDALWAQFFLKIDGNMNLGTCVQCGNWFMIEAGRGRSDKQYCSDACRMRAYRKRKGTG